MANKEALRELQSRLADRLAAARTQEQGKSWLAVECAGRGFLLPLREAGEIFPMAPTQSVPHTHEWFVGVANLRGHLQGVVDLAAFLGLAAADSDREQARLVGFNPAYELNCTLLVDRLSGLRSEGQMTVEPDGQEARPGFVGQRYRDTAGRIWQELNMATLAREEAFLKIVD